MDYTLGIIGGGNMAQAIVRGVLRFIPQDKIIISDIDEAKVENYLATGLAATRKNSEVAKKAEYVLFAVKPQAAQEILQEIGDLLAGKCVISIMAGMTIKKIKACIAKDARVARVMPNTPCMIAKGVSAVSFEAGCSVSDHKFVTSIFENLGKCITVPESKMDAVTSVSGSGPAYVYLFLQSMIEEGVAGGLTYEEARLLAVETFIGSAEMARNVKDIGGLIDTVCSKGGTTIQAITHFKEAGLPEIIKEGVKRSRERSKEIGDE